MLINALPFYVISALYLGTYTLAVIKFASGAQNGFRCAICLFVAIAFIFLGRSANPVAAPNMYLLVFVGLAIVDFIVEVKRV